MLKIDSPDILHKTEAGLVALGCGRPRKRSRPTGRYRRDGHRALSRSCGRRGAGAEDGEGAVAECIVGMKKDPQFGPTILFGLGGIIRRGVRGRLASRSPFEQDDAQAMIRETKGFKLLSRCAGRPKADVAAIEDVLLRLSQLALDLEPTSPRSTSIR